MLLTYVTLSVSPFGLPPPPMGEARALPRRSNHRSVIDPFDSLPYMGILKGITLVGATSRNDTEAEL